MNICDFDETKREPHSLLIIKWKLSDNGRVNTNRHATQAMCEKCFGVFNLTDIENFTQDKRCETSAAHSNLGEKIDASTAPQNT